MCTFSLYMKHFSWSATNANSRRTFKDIKKSIFFGYLKASGPNVSCVMACLLQKQPRPRTFIYAWHGYQLNTKNLQKYLLCVWKYQYNQTCDVSHYAKGNSVASNVEIYLHQNKFFTSIQELLLGKSHTHVLVWNNRFST